VIDARIEMDMGGAKGIFYRELDCEIEDPTLVWAVLGPEDTGLPGEHIITLWASTYVSGGIAPKVFEFLFYTAGRHRLICGLKKCPYY